MFWGDLLAGIFSEDAAVGVLFTDSAKIHRITGNSGIIVLGVNNFHHFH